LCYNSLIKIDRGDGMKDVQFSKERNQELMENIKKFFLNERGEEISSFQAGILLDFIIENIGPIIYNQALADAHALMSERLEDIYGLEKRQK